ncbi:FAD-dependent monooxygenase [Salinactinospora qingdaonensis]|uniref:FAD-dependent monooxygenase n=1 Tax=Salinactinospora qingdaonensis TaxID=702744 RepID=A0ABP7EWV1_9ACTN
MKAVICGAGIAGLSLAWWLEREGWEVTIAEHAPGLHGAGYMIDFYGSGYDAAERMGLLPAVTAAAYRVSGVVYRSPDGTATSTLDYGAFRRMNRDRVASLLRGDLEQLVFEALGEGVDIRFGTSVASVTTSASEVEVGLTDGSVERADVLVGADGIHSRVRELTFGPQQRFLRPLGYHTAAYIATDPKLWQRVGEAFQMVEAPGLQAGCYRVSENRVAAFFAHRARAGMPADPRAELRRRYGGLGWVIPRLLEHCPEGPPELYYDLMAQIEMPTWSQNRVVLLGDACYAVSLLAGQGASMAMGGAYVLADELGRAGDVPSALAAYETRLRPAIAKKQRAGRRTAEWFVPATSGRLLMRRTLLRLASSRALEGMLRPVLSTPGGSVVTDRASSATTGET